MLPMFNSHDIALWNRGEIEAPPLDVERVFKPDQGPQAANWADHVILCTPQDKLHDSSWRAWTAAAGSKTVVHLGHGSTDLRSEDKRKWKNISRYCDLFDVFALRATQDAMRSDQLRRARIACRRRALAIRDSRGPDIEHLEASNTFIAENMTPDPTVALA